MEIRTRLVDDYGFVLDDIIADFHQNLSPEYFSKDRLLWFYVTTPADSEDDFYTIDFGSDYIVLDIYNGIKSTLDDLDWGIADELTATAATSDIDEDDAESTFYFGYFGNKVFIKGSEDETDVYIKAKVRTIMESGYYAEGSTEIIQEYLNLHYFLYSEDATNVFNVLKRMKFIAPNVELENKNEAPIHKNRTRSITPWPL